MADDDDRHDRVAVASPGTFSRKGQSVGARCGLSGGPRNSTSHFAPNALSAALSGTPSRIVPESSVKNAAASRAGAMRMNCRAGASVTLTKPLPGA
jgi:hypothetical protein